MPGSQYCPRLIDSAPSARDLAVPQLERLRCRHWNTASFARVFVSPNRPDFDAA